MSGKGAKFQSLGDALGKLKLFKQDLVEDVGRSQKAAQPPQQQPTKPNLHSAFEDVEREMLQASTKAAQNKNQHAKLGKIKPVQGRVKPGQKPKQVLKAKGMIAAYNEIVAAGRAGDAKAAAPATPAKSKQHPAKANFDAVQGILAGAVPAIEPRPQRVSAATHAAIDTAIARGTEAYGSAKGPDEYGFIVGFDFGTSSLKLAIRQPYQAGDPMAAMPAPPELRSGGHPYLWQTAVWFKPVDETFSLVPMPGSVVLDGFKTGIIDGHSDGLAKSGLNLTRAHAATAFLALHFAHMLGWYHVNRPLGSVGGGHFLSVNVGIPVAAQDDRRAFGTFRRMVAAAHSLAIHAGNLTLGAVRNSYEMADEVLPQGYELVPELTAAIAGYAADVTSQPGSHMLVDVGASTLDIVAFNLVGRERISVFTAAVEILGSAALEAARSKGISDKVFKSACDWQFEHVYGQARSPQRASDGFHPQLRRRPVQLVTTGGGCATTVHEKFLSEMTHDKVLGATPAIRPTPPAAMTEQDCDRARLLLAFGLTRDVQELLELRLPSQVASIAPVFTQGPTMISKDMI